MPEELKYLSLFIAAMVFPILLSLIAFRMPATKTLSSERFGSFKLSETKVVVIILFVTTVALYLSNIHFQYRFSHTLPEYLSIAVALLLFIVLFRRIEIILIVSGAAILSWYWTNSLTALLEINTGLMYRLIVFGIQIGYGIVFMKALTLENKYGKHKPILLLDILLFACIVLPGGILVLFSEQALFKTSALYFVLGILVLFFVTHTFSPLLFNLLTKQKGTYRKEPLTLFNSFISVFSLLLFIVESLLLTLLIPILYLLPLPRKNVKYLAHYLISTSSRFILWINFTFKKEVINKEKIDFSKPSVIVPNHQSHLDLMLILCLHPKIIAITNKWVWNNPIYGFIVRFADYYPIYNGIDADFDKIRKKVAKGYSVLVFPEGSRTPDGKIKRYHQGAFKIAQELNLDIQPILIHGAFQCLPKTEFFLRSGKITLKYFDKIKVDPVNIEKNETYRLQAKALTTLMRKEFESLSFQQENTSFYKGALLNQYIYKGPFIEQETKRTLKLNNNYAYLNQIIPLKATIVELGCANGCLSLMLKYVSPQRQIIGLDQHADKIRIAKQAITNRTDIQFKVCNYTTDEFPPAEIYILNEMLHILKEHEQSTVLDKCLSAISKGSMVIIRVKRENMSNLNHELVTRTSSARGFSCSLINNSEYPSSTTYIIQHEQ